MIENSDSQAESCEFDLVARSSFALVILEVEAARFALRNATSLRRMRSEHFALVSFAHSFIHDPSAPATVQIGSQRSQKKAGTNGAAVTSSQYGLRVITPLTGVEATG